MLELLPDQDLHGKILSMLELESLMKIIGDKYALFYSTMAQKTSKSSRFELIIELVTE